MTASDCVDVPATVQRRHLLQEQRDVVSRRRRAIPAWFENEYSKALTEREAAATEEPCAPTDVNSSTNKQPKHDTTSQPPTPSGGARQNHRRCRRPCPRLQAVTLAGTLRRIVSRHWWPSPGAPSRQQRQRDRPPRRSRAAPRPSEDSRATRPGAIRDDSHDHPRPRAPRPEQGHSGPLASGRSRTRAGRQWNRFSRGPRVDGRTVTTSTTRRSARWSTPCRMSTLTWPTGTRPRSMTARARLSGRSVAVPHRRLQLTLSGGPPDPSRSGLPREGGSEEQQLPHRIGPRVDRGYT